MDLTQRPWRAFNALLYSIIPTPFFSLPLSRPSPLFQAGRASPGICRALGGRRQLQTNASSPFHPSRTQTRHQYEIHLENSSVVELCPDEEDIPHIFFNVRGGGAPDMFFIALLLCAQWPRRPLPPWRPPFLALCKAWGLGLWGSWLRPASSWSALPVLW